MILGRRWAKIVMWAIAIVMIMGVGQSVQALLAIHPPGDVLKPIERITAYDFKGIIVEQTAVVNLEVSVVEHLSFGVEPDTGPVKFIFQDAKNRLVFNSAINVEFSGDTVKIPLEVAEGGPGFWTYKPSTAPFTVSFRPNERGRFVDTLTFIFTAPIADTITFEVSGDGIGWLRFIDGQSHVDSVSLSFGPIRVGDSIPGIDGSGFPLGLISISATQHGKISDVITSDPDVFYIVRPQLEVQPEATEFLSIQFTPQTLGPVSGWAKVISDDFGVDTAYMELSGSGVSGLDYFTMDAVGEALDTHLVVENLLFDTVLAGTTIDTLIWVQNLLDHNVATELVMNDGSDFILLAQFGDTLNNRDTVYTGEFVGDDSVLFRDSVYAIGDTIRVGSEVIEVDSVFTIVPVVLKRTLAFKDSTRVWIRFDAPLRGTYDDTILTGFKAFIGDTVTVVTVKFALRGTIIGPSFEAARDSIDFGPLTPGLTLKDSLLLTNDSGQVPVDVVIDTTGLDSVFTLLTETSFSYGSGQQFYVVFRYTAADTLLHQATVLLTSSDPNNPSLSLILTGGTQAPVVVASPTSLAFGDVVLGDISTRTIMVLNNGLVTLNVSGISNTQGVYVASPTAFAIAPGDTQVVAVEFKPLAATAYSDTLRIATDDPSTPVYLVPLDGGGADPKYAGDSCLDFGATTLNAGSLFDSVSISNLGSRGNLDVRFSVKNGTYFALATDADSLVSVRAGTSRYITVRFDQSLPAVVTDSLILVTNDPATDTAYICLSGGGFFKQLDWVSGPLKDDSVYDYGKVSTLAAETLTSVLTNLGNDTLHIVDVSFYSGASGFAKNTPSAGALLQDELFDVGVVFTPMGAGLFQDTMLIITDDTAGNLSIIVPLEALVYVPGIQALSSTLVFDTTIIGQTDQDSVGFTNPGEAAVTLTSVTLTNGTRFALAGSPGSVAGDDTGFVKLIFAPLDTVTYYDTLVVTTSNPTDTLSIAISGAGAGGRYQDDVSSINFNPVPVFVTGQENFIIQNVGNQPLQIISIEAKDTTSRIFTRLSPATLILGAGEQATITIGFTPTASAAYVDTLVITTNDASNASILIPLFGETPDQDINFIPGRLVKITNPSIDAGGSRVGGFTTLNPVIYNVGLDTLILISGYLLDTGTTFSFNVSQLKDVPLAPGESISPQIVHRAVEKSNDSNVLVIISDDPDQDTVFLKIKAHGISGQLSLLDGDSTFTLGTVKLGTVDTSGEVSIQQTLGGTNSRVRLTAANFLVPPYPDITIQAGIHKIEQPFTFFDFDPATLPTLGRDSIITFRLIYAPTDTGSLVDVFRIIGTPDNSGDTISIPFQARGGAASISFSNRFFDFGTTSVGPVASVAISFDITNNGPDTLVVDTVLTINASAAHYNDAYVGTQLFLPYPWIIPPGMTETQLLVVKVTDRRVHYDTLAFVNNDFFNDPLFVYTRVVGIAPGDTGFVDTLRISDYETESGNVIIPLHFIFDEPIKRFTIPLVYTSKVFECVGLEFSGTLLENVDGLLPVIDTTGPGGTIVIKGNVIFGQPVVPDQSIGTEFVRMIFRASPGVSVSDSSITFDTTFIPPDLQYSMQDTALKVILPEFVAGRLDIVTAIDDDEVLPRQFELSQNFPNPFNPSTTISYTVPRASHVSLIVYNLLGQRIATLVDNLVAPGRYEIEWNGRDENGVSVSSGIYFYNLGAGEYSETLKMVLMK